MEMIQRLLLDGVNSQSTRLAIHLAHQHTTIIAPTATNARLAISYVAMVRAELAFHSSTFQFPIVPALHQNTIAS